MRMECTYRVACQGRERKRHSFGPSFRRGLGNVLLTLAKRTWTD